MIKRQQLEFGMVRSKEAHVHTPRGVTRSRAQWWFEQMKEAVGRAPQNGHIMSHLERFGGEHGHN